MVVLARTHHAFLELRFLKGIPVGSFCGKAARSSVVSRDTKLGPTWRNLGIENDFMRLG